MDLLKPYWDMLDQPVRWLFAQVGIIPASALLQATKGFLIFLALLLLTGVFRWMTRGSRGNKRLKQRISSRSTPTKVSVKALKQAKNYLGLGDYYASIGKTAMAIDYYTKAGAYNKAAEQYVKLGHTEAAAENFAEAGEFQRAAEICRNSGDWELAATYLKEADDLKGAAEAWMYANDFEQSALCHVEYLKKGARDEDSIRAAQNMLKRLRDSNKQPSEPQRQLAGRLARVVDEKQQPQTAADLYEQAGEWSKAGELYARAGKYKDAERCYEQSGDTSKLNQIRAASQENSGEYASAALEYERAGQYGKAAECYQQAGNRADAARCLEKAGEYLRAAREYADSQRWDLANKVLQNMPSEHQDYSASRSLLSKSFFEIGDYHACLASLENELEGAKVAPNNVDDFYLMGVAQEELGNLQQAQQIYHKVRAVNSNYRDTQSRIADLSEKIAHQTQMAGGMPGTMFSPPGGALGATIAAPGLGSGGNDAVTRAWQAVTQVNTVGETIFRGRYRIDHELGRGGMGVVYKAHDLELDRPVALKFLGTVSDTERFVREARAAAKLIHQNVIAIFDFSGQEGQAFIAMEYLDGQGLDKVVAGQGAMPPKKTVQLITKVCGALQAVHDMGIVHRDIKPANIVIGAKGEIKLLDFGLAKSKVDGKLTATGMIMGTPSYMPPEQVLGKEADERTDIYAMGLVALECLAGETVFASGDILERQLNDMPEPLAEKGIDVPEALEAACHKAVAKNPEDRFQSAQEFADALKAAIQ